MRHEKTLKGLDFLSPELRDSIAEYCGKKIQVVNEVNIPLEHLLDLEEQGLVRIPKGYKYFLTTTRCRLMHELINSGEYEVWQSIKMADYFREHLADEALF